jgi:gas vesicle protein
VLTGSPAAWFLDHWSNGYVIPDVNCAIATLLADPQSQKIDLSGVRLEEAVGRATKNMAESAIKDMATSRKKPPSIETPLQHPQCSDSESECLQRQLAELQKQLRKWKLQINTELASPRRKELSEV